MPDLYSRSVFINCPFSPDYQPIFRALVFACSHWPRCAREIADSSGNRLAKIEGIIRQSKFGIHDLSFMDLDPNTKLPRFNMSFELGLFMAAITADIDIVRHYRTSRVKILLLMKAIQKKRFVKFGIG